jgi:hypothetical protein
MARIELESTLHNALFEQTGISERLLYGEDIAEYTTST